MKDADIFGKTAEKLALMEHISPKYIKAHATQTKEGHISTGLLVTRLRDGDPAPMTEGEKRREGYKKWGINT